VTDEGAPTGSVDVIPPDAAISDEGIGTVPGDVLPIELPVHLRGLEALVARHARRLAEDPTDPADLARAARIVVQDLELRVSSYRALGRLATNPDSLPARLAGRRARGHP